MFSPLTWSIFNFFTCNDPVVLWSSTYSFMLAYPTTRLISQKDDLHAQKTKINYNFKKKINK